MASIIALGVGLRFLCLAWARGAMVDDAYITLRCAQNLLGGYGLVYNPGERVLATTGPLYGLLVAAATSITRGIASGYVLGALNIAAFAGSAILLADLAADLGRKAALLVLLVFACYVAFVDNSTAGMETPIFILGIAASLWLMRRGRAGWASLTVGLLVLVRPEAAIWALSLAAGACLAGRRPRAAWLLPGLAVAAAWVAISVPFYGSPIPHSVYSKFGPMVARVDEPTLARFRSAFVTLALLDFPKTMIHGGVARALLATVAPVSAALFGVGAALLIRRRKLAASLPLLFLGYVAVYVVARARLDFSWYGIPSGLAYWIACSVGLTAVLGWMVPVHLREMLARAALPLLTVILVLTTNWCWRTVRLPYYQMIGRSYEAAGRLIDAKAPADAVVLIDEAGMLGYAGRRHMVDLEGIVSPEVMKLRRSAGWWCPIGEIVQAVDPDLIAVSWTHANELLRERGTWMRTHYDTLGTFPGHVVLSRTGIGASPPDPEH